MWYQMNFHSYSGINGQLWWFVHREVRTSGEQAGSAQRESSYFSASYSPKYTKEKCSSSSKLQLRTTETKMTRVEEVYFYFILKYHALLNHQKINYLSLIHTVCDSQLFVCGFFLYYYFTTIVSLTTCRYRADHRGSCRSHYFAFRPLQWLEFDDSTV